MKEKYSSHAHQQFSFNFTFKSESVSLKIPQTGLQLGEWKITPFYDPIVSFYLFCFVFKKALYLRIQFVNLLQITKQQVNLFDSGKNIPKCELVLEWCQDTPPTLLHYSVGLVGACNHHYFLLRVNPGKHFNSYYYSIVLWLSTHDCSSEVEVAWKTCCMQFLAGIR